MPTTLTIAGISATIPIEDLGDRAIVENVLENGGFTAEVALQCSYAQRYDLIRGLRGIVVANGRTIVRTKPFAYPPLPTVYCMNVSDIHGIKPRRDTSGWLTFELARMTAHFAFPTYQFDANSPGGQNDPSGLPWTTTKFRSSGEVFSPPAGAYYIGPFPGGKPTEESSIGVIRPRTEIAITRRFLPFVPVQETETVIGGINAYPLTFGNKTYARGTILFTSMENEPTSDPTGLPSFDITYTLIANPVLDWNYFLSKNGSYQLLNSRADGSGTTPFPYVDFSILP